jgi:hypothetical protein
MQVTYDNESGEIKEDKIDWAFKTAWIGKEGVLQNIGVTLWKAVTWKNEGVGG